jgi:hypothetical protein
MGSESAVVKERCGWQGLLNKACLTDRLWRRGSPEHVLVCIQHMQMVAVDDRDRCNTNQGDKVWVCRPNVACPLPILYACCTAMQCGYTAAHFRPTALRAAGHVPAQWVSDPSKLTVWCQSGGPALHCGCTLLWRVHMRNQGCLAYMTSHHQLHHAVS